MMKKSIPGSAPPSTCIGLSRHVERRRLLRPFTVAIAAVIYLQMTLPLRGQAPKASEYHIKAAYLFNFAGFVGWPSSTSPDRRTFHICVLGKDPFGSALEETLAGGFIHGKTLTLARLSKPEEAHDCHILFISASEEDRLEEILAALKGSAVLTVGDGVDFSTRGVMIQFVLDQGKVRFEMNLAAATMANLMVSSELLKLARRVITERRHQG